MPNASNELALVGPMGHKEVMCGVNPETVPLSSRLVSVKVDTLCLLFSPVRLAFPLDTLEEFDRGSERLVGR